MEIGKRGTFAEYETLARQVSPSLRNNRGRVDFPVLGLQEESGRLASTLKNAMTSGRLELTPDLAGNLKNSLSDILWYVAILCGETKMTMDEVAEHSLAQLRDRAKQLDPDRR